MLLLLKEIVKIQRKEPDKYGDLSEPEILICMAQQPVEELEAVYEESFNEPFEILWLKLNN